MSKKNDINMIKQVIESKNGKLLTKEYINSKKKIEIICEKGHCFNISWSNLKTGRWCKKCAILKRSEKQKLTIDFVREEIKKRGGVLISNEYINNNTKLEILGSCNHIFKMSFGNIQSGSWCKFCSIKERADKQRNTQEFINKEIENRFNCEVLSEYKNNNINLKLKCKKCNRVFNGSWSDLQSGKKKCLHEKSRMKYTIEDVRKIIELKDGQLISDKYEGLNKKIKVKCNKCGVIWEPSFESLLKNHWCSGCSKNKKFDLDTVKYIINKNGGLLISKNYKNSTSKIIIKCLKCNTIWFPTFGSIQSGSWCPECSIFKSQKKVKDIIKEIFPDKEVCFNYKGFDWLYNEKTKGKQELDIFVPELKLAIEYDGQQHFRPVCFGGISLEMAKQKLKIQKYRDKVKNKKIAKNMNDIRYFLRFGYNEPITKEYIEFWLKEFGILKEKINEIL